MAGRIGAPNFRFPSNLTQVSAHDAPVGEGRDVHKARLGILEQRCQFIVALGIDRTVAGHGFDKKQPVFLAKIQHHVWHLAVPVYCDTKRRQPLLLEVANLVACIADIDDFRARCEARSEVGDDLLDEFAMCAGSLAQSPYRPRPVRGSSASRDASPISRPMFPALQDRCRACPARHQSRKSG